MVVVGIAEEPVPVAAFSLVGGRKSLAGSMIGSIAETQEMLDFSAKHGIVSDIETIAIDQVNRRLRARGQGRRPLPLRHRYGDALALSDR